MNKTKTLVFALIALALSQLPLAAQEFLVAAGSSSGTYAQFLKEMTRLLPPDAIVFKEVSSHGATENLDKLVNNEVQGAFMHSDVIYFRAQAEDMSKYKTLLALFKEEVHFLALSTSKVVATQSSGGTTIFGKTIGSKVTYTPTVFNTIEDLKGYRVGAAGGGYITAQTIRLQSQVPYSVVQFGTGKEVMDALVNGDIEAAVFVGGAPLPNLKDLDKTYKLLPIPSLIADRLKAVYKPTTITYNKMSPAGIPTVAADCIFVSKEYKTPRMANQLRQFRKSFFESLDELKETPGNHRKWQEVTSEEHGRWTWLELGEAAK